MSEPRTAMPEELNDIVALSDQMFRTKPGQVSMGQSFSHLLSADNIDNLYVVRQDDRIVSLLGWYPTVLHIAGCSLRTASLGSVCTDPLYRGRHYATQMLEMGLERLHEERCCLLLIYGARGLYLRHDAMVVGEVASIAIQAGQLNAHADADAEVRAWKEEDINDMIAVQQSELVYFERDSNEFKKLITLQSLLSTYPAEQQVYIRKKAGRLDSYIVFGATSVNDAIQGEVIEFAGEDEAVLDLIREALIRCNAVQFTITVPNYRNTLADCLSSSGCKSHREAIPGTILIPHFIALWDSLKPYFESRLGAVADSELTCRKVDGDFRIEFGGESLTVDRRQATSLVFDGPPPMDQGDLHDMLGRVFPLPFTSPKSLNFI